MQTRLLRSLSLALAGAVVATVLAAAAGCGNKPVAAVNGTRITETQFVGELKKTAGEPVLDGMIIRALIEDACKKSQPPITIDPKEIDKQINEMKAQAPTPELFQQSLAANGLTEASLRDRLKLDLEVQALSIRNVKDPTDEELKKFFDQYRKAWDKPERVTYSLILVSDKATADKVYGLASQKNASFADLAKQYSMDGTTRATGGRDAEMDMAKVPTELAAPARSVPIGGISKPIAVGKAPQLAYVILKIEDRKAAEPAKLEAIRSEVVRGYKLTRATPAQALLDELRKTAQVSVYAPELQSLAEKYRPPQQLPNFSGSPGEGGAPSPGTGPSTTGTPSQPGPGAVPAPSGSGAQAPAPTR